MKEEEEGKRTRGREGCTNIKMKRRMLKGKAQEQEGRDGGEGETDNKKRGQIKVKPN